MSILPHVTFGAVAGSLMPHPALAAVSGVASHLLLDYIPHYDPEIRKGKISPKKKFFYKAVLVLDLTLSLVVLIFLWPNLNMFLGGLFGALTDLDNFLQYRFPNSNIFPLIQKLGIPTHNRYGSSWHNQTNLFWGIVNQSWVTGLSSTYIITKLYSSQLFQIFSRLFIK